jgi:hypothetical protein
MSGRKKTVSRKKGGGRRRTVSTGDVKKTSGLRKIDFTPTEKKRGYKRATVLDGEPMLPDGTPALPARDGEPCYIYPRPSAEQRKLIAGAIEVKTELGVSISDILRRDYTPSKNGRVIAKHGVFHDWSEVTAYMNLLKTGSVGDGVIPSKSMIIEDPQKIGDYYIATIDPERGSPVDNIVIVPHNDEYWLYGYDQGEPFPLISYRGSETQPDKILDTEYEKRRIIEHLSDKTRELLESGHPVMAIYMHGAYDLRPAKTPRIDDKMYHFETVIGDFKRVVSIVSRYQNQSIPVEVIPKLNDEGSHISYEIYVKQS